MISEKCFRLATKSLALWEVQYWQIVLLDGSVPRGEQAKTTEHATN